MRPKWDVSNTWLHGVGNWAEQKKHKNKYGGVYLPPVSTEEYIY
jgi:hypothetical protein